MGILQSENWVAFPSNQNHNFWKPILILGGQKGDFESIPDGEKKKQYSRQILTAKVSYHLQAHICSHITSEFSVIPVYCYFKKKNQSLLL